MQFVSELFRSLLLPPTGPFMLLAFGWLVRLRWHRCGNAVIGTSMLLVVILCIPAGADLLVAPLEAMTAPLDLTKQSGAQAIVVLAAGRMENAPEYANAHTPDYIALARLVYGAHLQHATGLPLLISGGNRSPKPPYSSKADDMARAMAEDLRTPVTWIEGNSETTAQNASFTAAMLGASGIKRILLVTDAMHMPRAQAVFQRSGLQVIAAPTMFFTLERLGLLEFLPNAEGLRRSYYATYEWMGMAWYWLRSF